MWSIYCKASAPDACLYLLISPQTATSPRKAIDRPMCNPTRHNSAQLQTKRRQRQLRHGCTQGLLQTPAQTTDASVPTPKTAPTPPRPQRRRCSRAGSTRRPASEPLPPDERPKTAAAAPGSAPEPARCSSRGRRRAGGGSSVDCGGGGGAARVFPCVDCGGGGGRRGCTRVPRRRRAGGHGGPGAGCRITVCRGAP